MTGTPHWVTYFDDRGCPDGSPCLCPVGNDHAWSRAGYCLGKHFFRLLRDESEALYVFQCERCPKTTYRYRDMFATPRGSVREEL